MYIALNYIGNRYTPGEAIGDDLPEETINRLIEKGAVKYEPDEEAGDDKRIIDETAAKPEPDAKAPDEPAQEVTEDADDETAIEPLEIDATEALVTTPKKRGRGGKS